MISVVRPTLVETAWQLLPLPGSGTQTDPFNWPLHATVAGTTSTLPIAEGEEWSVVTVYAVVRLQASTEYTWSISGMSGMDTQAWILSMAGATLATYAFDWEYETWTLTYTPSTTGDYLFKIGAFSYGGAMSVSMTPLPTAQTPWVERSAGALITTGFDNHGRLVRHRDGTAAALAPVVAASPVGLTSNTSDPDWIVAASAEYNNDSRASQSFSSVPNAAWTHMSGFTGWISWRNLRRKVLVRGYTVSGGGASTANNGWVPTNWTLEGSNDGLTWTVLETVENGFGGAPTAITTVTRVVAGNYTSYYYHRLNISDTYDHSDGVSVGQIVAVGII